MRLTLNGEDLSTFDIIDIKYDPSVNQREILGSAEHSCMSPQYIASANTDEELLSKLRIILEVVRNG